MEENRVAIQECSPGWSDSVTPGMCVVIIRGIGASDSVAFYTTVGIIERSGRLRSKSPVADNLFPWVRSRLRHALTHGYCRKSLRDSVIRPYLNRIARLVRPPMSIYHKPEGSLPEAKRFAVSVPAIRVGTRASGLRNLASSALLSSFARKRWLEILCRQNVSKDSRAMVRSWFLIVPARRSPLGRTDRASLQSRHKPPFYTRPGFFRYR